MDRLPPQPWMTAAATRAVMGALSHAGGEARFVGGCVRDAVLGRAVDDIDIATPLQPAAVVAALEAAGLRAVPTGIAHGTVTALAHDEEGRSRPFEITTLRRDVETDGRRAVVAFSTNWAEDAGRRDFRLNALYLAADGALYDPTGAGVADAMAGRIVFVGDPETRIREDTLRILRFFRFYAWYGQGAPDAAALAACAALAGGIRALSGERLAKETMRLLAAPDARPALRAMSDAGVLGAVLPGAGNLEVLDRLVALEQACGWAADPPLRLAALLPETGIKAALERLRLSNALAARVRAAAEKDAAVSSTMTPVQARAALYRVGATTFMDRLRLSLASGPANLVNVDEMEQRLAEAAAWSYPALPLTGEDILAAGAPPGPAVGAVRRAVEAWWVAADFPDDRAAALAKAEEAVRALQS